ncbi:MAG: plastocyanin/azurin family copper-binding protein [Actinomycetota bacterium]
MRRAWGRAALVGTTVGLILAAGLPSAHAVHFYRSTDGGCAPADGALTDDPPETTPTDVVGVVVGHNTFSEGLAGSGLSVESLLAPTETHVKAGEAITWTWNSAHCHSVTSTGFSSGTTRIFESGFVYPVTPPETPRLLPGLFEYPILDDTPTLSFTHTFTTPGTYDYFCVHHSSIGMNGVVIVEP